MSYCSPWALLSWIVARSTIITTTATSQTLVLNGIMAMPIRFRQRTIDGHLRTPSGPQVVGAGHDEGSLGVRLGHCATHFRA